jgi:hypothetical protein
MNRFPRFLPALAAALLLTFSACDSNEPDPDGGAGEEEVISNVDMVLTPQNGSAFTVAAVFDEEGVRQSVDPITLTAGTVYGVEVNFRNRFEDDPEELDEEIKVEENIAHQLYVIPEGGVADDLTISDRNADDVGQPLGTSFTLTVGGDAASGDLRVVLRHYEGDTDELVVEQKGDDLDPTTAEVPGVVENDVDFTFPVTISG